MKLLVSISKKRARGRHKKNRRRWDQHLREWIWPSMGISAFLRFLEIRIKRSPNNRHRVALGLAIGVFVSFLPFIGTHILWVFLLCLALKGSFVTGMVGSLVGNPWTFPIIWLWTYELGHFILRNQNVPLLPDTFSITDIWQNLAFFWEIYIWPMTVGGIPTGIVAAVATYYLITFNIASYQMARQKFLANRRAERKRWQNPKKLSLPKRRKKAKNKR